MDQQRLTRIVVIIIILLLIYFMLNPNKAGSNDITDFNPINYKRFFDSEVFDNLNASNNLNRIYG